MKANFAGTYGGDYNTLESTKTAVLDKYNTTIFRNDECWRGPNALERFDRQPLPDYKLWEEVKELHYIGYEERRDFPEGPWDKSPGLFLPEKILDMCFRVLPTPSTETLVSIAFLALVSVEEASNYFTTTYNKLKQQKEEGTQREAWRQHSLYSESREETLAEVCSDSGLFAVGKKHELVRRIVENSTMCDTETVSPLKDGNLYDGNVQSIPSSSAGLIKLSVAQLRAILRTHNILEVGTKEELVTRVGLLKAGQPEAAFSRERLCILHMIEVAKEITKVQYELDMATIRRKRKFQHGEENTLGTRTLCLKDVLSPRTLSIDVGKGKLKQNVGIALEPLRAIVAEKEEMSRQRIGELEKCTKTQIDENLSKNAKTPTVKKERVSKHAGKTKVKERSHRERRPPVKLREPAEQMEGKQVFTVGQTVEVLWNEKDLEGTNWEPGWYKGEIERFDEENDIVFIWYYKDHAVYSLDATGALLDEVIRPA